MDSHRLGRCAQRGMALTAIRILGYVIALTGLVFFIGLAGLIGLFVYLFSGTCDDVIPVPVVNGRGDVAEEQLQVCTGIGTVLNYSITLQLRDASAPRTLVQFSPSPDVAGDTYLQWTDDDMLTVDLGKVSWVSPKIHRVGSVSVNYIYIEIQ